MTAPSHALSVLPDTIYIVVARVGGPVVYSSWSWTMAQRKKKALRPGDYVVRKYVATHRVGTGEGDG